VNAYEYVAWAPLLVGILALGIFPRIVFGVTSEAVGALVKLL
jgi:NADH:ubiquinone oxidoreductase subunit 4 (subunit M)